MQLSRQFADGFVGQGVAFGAVQVLDDEGFGGGQRRVHGGVAHVGDGGGFALGDAFQGLLTAADEGGVEVGFGLHLHARRFGFRRRDDLLGFGHGVTLLALVLGQKQSQARIRYSEGISSIAYPVEVGNKLFKPGWKPGSPVRWALAGHFDLNGLGRDETELLRKQLAKQGIVVDAYLDLNTLKVVGELNYGIDYLVIGTRPTGETARVIGDERKTAIENAINEMVAKAQTMGISVMQHRVFLPIAGFDLPRVQAFAQFPGGAAAPMGEEKKPMEEKKDEGK